MRVNIVTADTLVLKLIHFNPLKPTQIYSLNVDDVYKFVLIKSLVYASNYTSCCWGQTNDNEWFWKEWTYDDAN